MADVQNVVTLGIGSAPGDIHFFLLLGLDVNPGAVALVSVGPSIRAAMDGLAIRAGEAIDVEIRAAMDGLAIRAGEAIDVEIRAAEDSGPVIRAGEEL